MSVYIQFYGHACFGLFYQNRPELLVDPYLPGGLDGAVQLKPIEAPFKEAVSTHDHIDHHGFSALPETTRPVTNDQTNAQYVTDAFTVFHDEYGGELRGGTTSILTMDYHGLRIVHAGDIGERLTRAQVQAWNPGDIDVLIVPVGGYFTVGADAAYALTDILKPQIVMPCHAADHGVELPELEPSRYFLDRYPSDKIMEYPAGICAPEELPSEYHSPPIIASMTPSHRLNR